MGVSLSGLASGMDTDSIVAALVSGYSIKKDKYVKAQTKLEWKMDAWKDLNTKIKNFYQKYLSDMRFSTAFNKKKSAVSSTKATVSASSSAVNGTQKLKINKLATSGYLTGGVVSKSDGKNIQGSTKLSELGIEDGSKITVNAGGKEKSITVKSSSTVNEFVVALKEAGVNASFDEKNQRFFVSSKVSGEAGDFSLIADNEAGADTLRSLGLAMTTESDMENYRYYAGLSSDELDTVIETAFTKQKTAFYNPEDAATVKKLKDGLKKGIEADTKQVAALEAENEKLDYRLAAAATYDSEYGNLSDEDRTSFMVELNRQISELSEKTDRTEDEEADLKRLKEKNNVYVTLSAEDADKDKYLEDLNQSKADTVTKIEELNDGITLAEEALADDDKFKDYVQGLNDNIQASNDALKARLTDYYSTKQDMAQKYVDAYDLVHTDGVDTTSAAYKEAAALLGDTGSQNGPTSIVGKDAEIELNGATFVSNSNTFQINGLTITANELTGENEEITLTTETDSQAIYDMIKNFFTEYNTLINEMDKLYNADSARGYEPLTDEEKEALSDKEVEKWEEKIKDSLLRRDSTLDSVSSAIKMSFQSSFEINGKKYSLASFGIKTLSYFSSSDNEKSAFHIDGDKDDIYTSGNQDKLMAAIGSDPDTVATFFNKLAQNVYDTIYKKMKTSSISSTNTVYNDKVMKREYDEYTDIIKKWEDKIEAYEAKYRKQFTAMEKALATLNSQKSYLSGLFG